MAAELIIALFFLGLTAITSYLGYRFYLRPTRVYERLVQAEEIPYSPVVAELVQSPRKQKLLDWIRKLGEKVPASEEEFGRLRRDLISAGYRSEGVVRVFYGLRVALAGGLVIVALVLQADLELAGPAVLAWVMAAALGGYLAPTWGLRYLINRRQLRLRRALPDALDLMVVCVEAGLGLDQAIGTVTRELKLVHKELCEELELVSLEMRAGTGRTEALRRLADRTRLPEISKLVAVLIQSDRFGTSIAEALRTHSEYMRLKRRQEAEERANKVAVKLVFPIFFFILPAVILVAAGPAFLRVFRSLLPMMQRLGGQ